MTIADRLLEGSIGLADLWRDHPAAFDLYSLGHADGRESLRAELEQAHADADRLYRAAFEPTVRSQLVARVLDSIDVQQYRARSAAA